jgi:aspartyl-tRNA(Asn)/glutamyl-tRNA(Gln) amidotransferase subunit C
MFQVEEVRKVAHLARLQLTAAEEAQFTDQLGTILDYFAQLSELDVSKVEPTSRAINIKNVTRPDILQPYPDKEAILSNAPDREEDFFKVPQIMGES